MSLFLGRIPSLSSSLPLNRSTLFASLNDITQASSPNPHFAVEYLVQSCGLSSDEALRASKYIHHLKSPSKPDTVLQFLRQTGISESDIRAAVSRDSRILCSHVEKNWKPNIAKLREVGISIEDMSVIISRHPGMFLSKFVTKVDFWLGVLGSVGNLSLILKRHGSLLNSNLENVVMPNLSFLREQCGLSLCKIHQLIKLYPSVIVCNPENLKIKAKWAEELGIARSSGMYVHALSVVIWMNKSTIDARVNNLKRLGLSQEEVTLMISKAPSLLNMSEELVCSKMEFLISEAGCGKIDVVRNPSLLKYNLENRLIPRNVVRKLLMSKGIPAANQKFATFMTRSEEEFVEKFVMPYEHTICGLHRAYADAFAEKIGGIE